MSLVKPRKPKPVTQEPSPTIVIAPFEERLLRINEVVVMVGLAKSTIYKLISEGRFPKQIHRTARASTWKLSEVQAYIDGTYAPNSASVLHLNLVRKSGVGHA